MNPVRINLLATPRNISTALMYSFSQRNDTLVFDEPLYGHYLSKSKAAHPGRKTIIQSMECDGEVVIRDLLLGPHHHPVLFFKNMTHHLVGLDLGFLSEMLNLFLIRNPYDMLSSYIKVNPHPQMQDIGLKRQYELFKRLNDHGQVTAVIDAERILQAPEKMLIKICQQVGIAFQEDMLTWQAGPKPEDGVWAKYWYKGVHNSSGFNAYRAKKDRLPTRVIPLFESVQPYYDLLHAHALKVT